MTAKTGILVGALVGLIIGFGAGWFGVSRSGVPLEESNIDEHADVSTPPPGDVRIPFKDAPFVETEVVEVKDQVAGDKVFISRVAVAQAGWVAIQEDVDGMPGNILGAHRFDAGTYQGVVTLLRDTIPGETYYATLWHDNGDGVFDYTTDRYIHPPVQMMFEAY